MSDIVGGLRARLIRESLFEMLNAGLTDLGWFDPTRPYSPIEFVSRGQNQDEVIPINMAALSDESDREGDVELGSTLTEQTWQMYVDFFAEDDALGLHFIKDVRDILRGRFTTSIPNAAHRGPMVPVYDYRQATPPVVFHVEVQNTDTDKPHGFLKPWLEHWYVCIFEIVDYYDSEG